MELDVENACILIDEALSNLDRLFAVICRKYSQFSILAAIQHHVPFLLVAERADQAGDSQELFNTMSVVAFKFASQHREAAIKLTYREYRRNADQFFANQGVTLREDLVLLQLGVKCQRSLLNIRRTVNKGATLLVGSSGTSFELVCPDDIKEAIRVYENRAWKSPNSLGWQGFFVPFASLKNDTTFDFPLGRIDWDALREEGGQRRDDDPSPFVITLDSLFLIFDGTLFFERQIAEKFGLAVYITDFFAFLHSVWASTVDRIRQGGAPYGWGYEFWSWKSFRTMLATTGPESYSALMNLIWKYLDENAPLVVESMTSRYWLRVYRRLLAFLSYNSRQPSTIEHRQLYPAKFLFTTSQGIFAHLGLLPYFLHSLWSEFELTGEIGSQKGPAFEQRAYDVISSDILVPVWEPGKKVPFRVGRRVGSDIDLCFRKGAVGFVISCKSYSNTRQTYEGDRRAVWLRWTDIQSWVTENDELADAMVKHASEIPIPPDMKALVPIVCIPQVEYLWNTSDRYMLSENLPRVLTPWEFKEWATEVTEETLLALPFVRMLGTTD